MILLSVLSYNGAPTDVAAVSFDELGGSIGRADSNHLVLPDPERTISRVHARVVFRSNGYYIVDNGSNPISVNGSPLGIGREHLLAAGDTVQIGGYLLEAAQRAASGRNDPLTDLFGDVDDGLAAAPAGPTTTASVLHTWAPEPAQRQAQPEALTPGHIPDNWNPFGDDLPTARSQSSGLGSSPAVLASDWGEPNLAPVQHPMVDMGPPGGDSLDALFGLSGLSAAAPGADPLGGDLHQALAIRPNTAAHADPLLALARPGALAPETFADLGSELNTPMPLQRRDVPPPQPQPTPTPLPTPAPPSAAAAGSVKLPAGAVFSWDAPAAAPARPAPLPRAPVLPAEPSLVAPHPLLSPGAGAAATPAPLDRPAAAGRAAWPGGAPPAPSAAASSGEGDAALLAALLDGLAVPGLRIDRLTPAMMLLIGQFLRESTRGAIELLAARSALKREMRAEMTMIVARENNPLKFSPSVEVALHNLLGPPGPGFMAPVPAVRDAFDDLRAHQLGVMAGMKAALEGVLERFDPAVLEGKLTRKSAIASLIPATRKARLWELYQELYGQISAEAQDDFDELFGRAFLRAYEAQLDSLARQRAPQKG
jgi:type VI secretion system FHA domain protein